MVKFLILWGILCRRIVIVVRIFSFRFFRNEVLMVRLFVKLCVRLVVRFRYFDIRRFCIGGKEDKIIRGIYYF